MCNIWVEYCSTKYEYWLIAQFYCDPMFRWQEVILKHICYFRYRWKETGLLSESVSFWSMPSNGGGSFYKSDQLIRTGLSKYLLRWGFIKKNYQIIPSKEIFFSENSFKISRHVWHTCWLMLWKWKRDSIATYMIKVTTISFHRIGLIKLAASPHPCYRQHMPIWYPDLTKERKTVSFDTGTL